MSDETTSRYVRVPAEIVVEVIDPDAVRQAARDAVAANEDMATAERAEAMDRIDADLADAVALVVDLEGLLADGTGLEIVEATWSAEVDPDYEPFDEYEDEDEEEDLDEQ